MSTHNEQKELCPYCGQLEGVPLVWGKPRGDAVDRVAQNEWVCGGCDIWAALDGGLMNRECRACGERWFVRSDDG